MFARLLPALLLAGCAATPTPDAVSMPSLAAANLSGASFSESCEDWDEWDKAAPPFRILGDSWYVGTCGIAAILVASPQGHVLIDSGTEAGGELILANLRRIGVDPEDVRYILASHEHFDHVGGHAILAKATGAQALVNCASQEYFGAVDVSALHLPIITPQFLELKEGQAKIVSFYAKKARGAMARFIVQNRLSDPAQIVEFDLGGYAYQPEQSTPEKPVFLRDYPA